jgi:hypothetical protein
VNHRSADTNVRARWWWAAAIAVALAVLWWWMRASPAAADKTDVHARGEAGRTQAPVQRADRQASSAASAARPASGATAATDAAHPAALAVSIDAPASVTSGTTFDLLPRIDDVARVRSARFSVSYDTDVLELVEIVDATGTVLLMPPTLPGRIDLEYDTRLGASRMPAARFLARSVAPYPTQVELAVEAQDASDARIPVKPVAPTSVMIVPGTQR